MNSILSTHLLAGGIATPDPNPLALLPFLGLLLCIALLPVSLKHHWERFYHLISVGLGAVVVFYYVFVLGDVAGVLRTGADYAGFMAVIGSLYVISGGIYVRVRGETKPWENTLFLLAGVVLGCLIGTTGASMLMIRPWIRMNKYRFTGHHIAFFIFLVSNIGGGLVPLGPPLFMGYEKGVPFWWAVERCWQPWSVTTVCLLAIFYVIDRANYVKAPRAIREAETASGGWRINGAHNAVYMALALAAIIVLPFGAREAALVAAAALSYYTTPEPVRTANEFTFGPIQEVAWLFAGIFATMKPALDYMVLHAGGMGLRSDAQFYWLSGLFSAVLDNAPTYLTFLAAALGIEHLTLDNAEHMRAFLAQHGHYLVAIAMGASSFGAATYIGNGPNLMVKAVAEHAKVRVPGFFGYIVWYSLPVLGPVFALVTWLFFSR